MAFWELLLLPPGLVGASRGLILSTAPLGRPSRAEPFLCSGGLVAPAADGDALAALWLEAVGVFRPVGVLACRDGALLLTPAAGGLGALLGETSLGALVLLVRAGPAAPGGSSGFAAAGGGALLPAPLVSLLPRDGGGLRLDGEPFTGSLETGGAGGRPAGPEDHC